jgi:eukaryotic-like serine/threonine-protein kinase
MDGPGHTPGGWPGARSLICASCGSSIPAPADRCPRCGRLRVDDDTLTVLGDTPLPTPSSAGASEEITRFAAPSDDVKSYVAAEDSADDVTRIVTPGDAADDVTRFGAPADAAEDVTRFVAADEAQTIAAPSDAPADAMTAATPATPTPPGARRATRTNNAGPLEVGQSFGPRYHIIRLLGAGGMGAVYQAWDAELGVAVAIKVIRPEVMEDPATAEEVGRRFKRELLLARQVTHKNVVRIHDIGDIDGIKYITMSYVEGTDLASILKQDGKRPIPELLGIARSVISGLVAAHTAGVVHRDLKPANIMISMEGDALIMDFGIAHSTGDPAAAPKPGAGAVPEHLTRTTSLQAATTLGSIIGTVEYMAPEQARGQPIDQRVDVYAFGLILYDALLGQRRVSSGAAAVEELQRRMAAPPPPLQALSSDIPAPLAALVARCVEPDAEKRFQTSAEVAAELDRLDEHGHLIPVKKTIGLPQMAAIVALLTLVFGGSWWYFREPPAVMHDPVTVLIADFTNTTGDAALNHTLEPMIRLSLEEAGFITAIDRTQMRSRLSMDAPDNLDEGTATDAAAKQGVGVVLAGSIARSGSQYELIVRAKETVTGKELASVRKRVRTREEVLAAATESAVDVREALGDDTSDSTRRFAADTLSATSIEVIRHYATAMEAQADLDFEKAHESFSKALEGDPDFGLAYAGMASTSRNLERPKEAEKYAREAVRLVGRMTEREKYRARGLLYMSTGEYDLCLKEFGDMLQRYAADVVALNNVAYCQSQLRRISDAVTSLRRAVPILPKRTLYRLNLALYLAYASDFPNAETEAQETRNLGDEAGLQPLAYAQMGQERVPDAIASYDALSKVHPRWVTLAMSGLADAAMFEGRFKEAISIYGRGLDADRRRKDGQDRAAAKLAGIAYAELQRGQRTAAVAAAKAALTTGESIRPRLRAALVLVEAGEIASAQTVAKSFAGQALAEARASARIIDAAVLRSKGDYNGAARLLEETNGKILDTWMGQFELGRAYLAAGRMTPADSAFDACIRRSGELFLDEEPTYGLLPAVYYLKGQAQEADKIIGFADLYQRYLRIREKAGEDPNLKDVRARVAAQPGR